MNTKTLIQIFGMILLAIMVSIIMLALVYALLNQHLLANLATISWNG
jgi:hypothetical protein